MIEQTSVSSHSSMGSPSRMALSRAQCSHHCEKKAMPSVPLLGRYFSATTHLPELVVDANRCPRLKQRALVEGHGLSFSASRAARMAPSQMKLQTFSFLNLKITRPFPTRRSSDLESMSTPQAACACRGSWLVLQRVAGGEDGSLANETPSIFVVIYIASSDLVRHLALANLRTARVGAQHGLRRGLRSVVAEHQRESPKFVC